MTTKKKKTKQNITKLQQKKIEKFVWPLKLDFECNKRDFRRLKKWLFNQRKMFVKFVRQPFCSSALMKPNTCKRAGYPASNWLSALGGIREPSERERERASAWSETGCKLNEDRQPCWSAKSLIPFVRAKPLTAIQFIYWLLPRSGRRSPLVRLATDDPSAISSKLYGT